MVLYHTGTLMEDPTSDLVHITDLTVADLVTEAITAITTITAISATTQTMVVTEVGLHQDQITVNPTMAIIQDLALEADQTADIALVLEVDQAAADTVQVLEADQAVVSTDLVVASTAVEVAEVPQDTEVNVKKD